MKLFSYIEKRTECWYLIGLSVVFFLLRLPSLAEPYWYGDEGVYQVVGKAIREGRMLYSEIWDNKPPLLYLLYAVFNGDQFSLRFLSLLVGIVSVIFFYYLSEKIIKGQKARYISTSLFAVLFAIPAIEGNIANAENFMLLPIILAAVCIFSHSSGKQAASKNIWSLSHPTGKLIAAGLLLSIAFLFKIVAVFDFAAFSLFLFFSHTLQYSTNENLLRSLQAFLEKTKAFFISFITPIALTLLFFLVAGDLSSYLESAFFQNIGYVGYGNQFFFPQGLLFLKIFLLIVFCSIIYFKRHAIGIQRIFVLLWLGFSIFNVFFTQRPYTHYALLLLPAVCLGIGLLFERHKTRPLLAGVLCIFLAITLYHFKYFFSNKKTFGYYQNFVSFVTNKKSLTDYQAFFDGDTPRDYEVAMFLKGRSKNDEVFIWGNNPQIYALSNKLPIGRFTVAYHVTAKEKFTNETGKQIDEKKPKYIVILDDVRDFPFSLHNYTPSLLIQDTLIYERLIP